MALATKCPQCGALFRVVADQLKLRGGLVRCGQCRAVFDAIGSLTYVDDAALAQSHTVSALTRPITTGRAPPAEESPAAAAARQALGPSTTLRITPIPPATLAGVVAPRTEPLLQKPTEEASSVRRRAKAAARALAEPKEVSPLQSSAEGGVPTLLAASPERDPVRNEPVTEAQGIELAASPVETPEPETTKGEPPPSFVRPKRATPRGFSIVFGGGTLLLAVLAAIQLAVVFRAELMIHSPQSRLLLMDLCAVFRCSVNWPTQADQLAVIGSELQAIPGTNALELTAVVRNRAGFKQSLPAVEVTLTDARNQVLARKVFTPVDYLASAGEPSARIQEGLGPGSDFTIRIFFEARGLQPAGFLVYPFYL